MELIYTFLRNVVVNLCVFGGTRHCVGDNYPATYPDSYSDTEVTRDCIIHCAIVVLCFKYGEGGT